MPWAEDRSQFTALFMRLVVDWLGEDDQSARCSKCGTVLGLWSRRHGWRCSPRTELFPCFKVLLASKATGGALDLLNDRVAPCTDGIGDSMSRLREYFVTTSSELSGYSLHGIEPRANYPGVPLVEETLHSTLVDLSPEALEYFLVGPCFGDPQLLETTYLRSSTSEAVTLPALIPEQPFLRLYEQGI